MEVTVSNVTALSLNLMFSCGSIPSSRELMPVRDG